MSPEGRQDSLCNTTIAVQRKESSPEEWNCLVWTVPPTSNGWESIGDGEKGGKLPGVGIAVPEVAHHAAKTTLHNRALYITLFLVKQLEFPFPEKCTSFLEEKKRGNGTFVTYLYII